LCRNAEQGGETVPRASHQEEGKSENLAGQRAALVKWDVKANPIGDMSEGKNKKTTRGKLPREQTNTARQTTIEFRERKRGNPLPR